MGVNEERWGRCSPGHSFQEDCTHEQTVPRDRSLAASVAQKRPQVSAFTQEPAFLSIFQESLSESSPMGGFHADVTALASYLGILAKQKIHKLMASRGDPGQGWEITGGQAGSVSGRKAKGKGGNHCSS